MKKLTRKNCDLLFKIYKEMTLPLKVSFWFFFCSVVTKGISFLTTPVFTRLLTTEEYGIISVFNSWEQILMIFVTFSLSNSVFNVGLLKFSDDKDNFQTSMLGLTLLCTCNFSLLTLIFYRYLEPLFQLEIPFMVIMIMTCFCTTIISMWQMRERFEYNYKKMTVLTLIDVVMGSIFSVTLVVLMKNKALGKVLGNAICFAGLGIFCCISFIRRSGKLINLKYWLFAFKYNFPMLPHFLSTVFLNQVDRIMIKYMCGAGEAGIYSVSYNCVYAVLIINQSLTASYNPWLMQRLKDNRYIGIKKIVNLILICYLAVLAFIILFAPEIIRFMAPDDYYEGIFVIPPIASSMFFIMLFNLIAPVEHFSLKTKFISAASTISVIVNVITNYVFIRNFGYMAAGYTTLVCYVIYALAHYIYMKKICDKDLGIKLFDDKTILFLSFMAIIISIVSSLLYLHMLIRYFFIVGILVMVILKRNHVIELLEHLKEK